MRVFIGAVMPNRRPFAYIEYPAIVNPLAIGHAFLASCSNHVLVLVERQVYCANSSRRRVGSMLWTLGSSNSCGMFNAEGNFFICCCMEMGCPHHLWHSNGALLRQLLLVLLHRCGLGRCLRYEGTGMTIRVS